MTHTDTDVARSLPALRRYARCLTGSQSRGDAYVRMCLEAVLEDPSMIEESDNVRVALFRAFHRLWASVADALGGAVVSNATTADRLERRVLALPAPGREALLLATLAEFSVDEVAAILSCSRGHAEGLLDRARADLNAQTATRVLIIEDEPVIAFDLASIVTAMGHTVVGIADTRDRAVELAFSKRPGVVLADIQLRGPGSGIEATREILESMDVPVIFVTAFPERLLQGAANEPTYLVTKPFEPETLQVTISQALLLHAAPEKAAVG
jgi:CheY-like chemotaxis protein